MLSLTPQERQVILFLMSIALFGMGINFTLKTNFPIQRVITVDDHIAKIDINKVTYEDLLRIRNISPTLAKRIIAYREIHGEFASLEELKDIKGIGEYRYQKLKDLFFIE